MNWCPVPIANASVINATRISDDSTRPKPGRRSRSSYRCACEKTSTVMSVRNGSQSVSIRQSTPQSTGSRP